MSKNSKIPVLSVKNLAKEFNGFRAIKDFSFEVGEGEILGFLGPNGAGKSTTINCILGVIKPDEGKIKIFGQDLFKNRSEIMQKVNYCSAEYNISWNLKVYEALLVYCSLYKVKNPKEQIEKVLSQMQASGFRNKFLRDLSFGERARISLCKSFLNDPKLLLLDEPMASLDPDMVDKGIKLIKKMQRENKISILYTSHNMWEIEQIASKVVFVNHGKVVAQGTPLDLTRKHLNLDTNEPNLREVFIELSRSQDEHI